MKRLGLKCPLYLTQNDGTLTSASEAAKLPVRTFNSGATNSMRGAGYLAGFGQNDGSGGDQGRSVIVVDIGGTSTDVGVVLPSGYPRLSGAHVESKFLFL
jgi:N-methylhydantoinase A/oxoprolinase/acetone carboxylase beta subunit